MQFLFENHSLNTDRRELRRGCELVAVEPQVFDLLIYLLTHRDRVVSKDDLFASVWAGRVVSDSTLTSRINAARDKSVIFRLLAVASLGLLLAGCLAISPPVWGSALGFGAATVTFDTHVLDDCIAGKTGFDCFAPRPATAK